MKTIISVLLVVTFQVLAFGQCSTVSVQISSSDTAYVQLYHAGFFNIDSGYANVCEWEVTTFQGAVVHQGTTSGAWADQSFRLFNHSVPITDSMEVTLFITNPIAGISCSIKDTLFWEETQVLPGSFIGNWNVVGDYGGVENVLTSIGVIARNIEMLIYPNPSNGRFRLTIEDGTGIIRYSVFDVLGKEVANEVFVANGKVHSSIDLRGLSAGMYTLQLQTENGIYSERLVKD
ncbi:MAG: hypothetical protein ACI85F_002882 [Bacteroidia bacterium]|jgi:hypothetical protein